MPTAESRQGADHPLGDELRDFIGRPFAARGHLPDREVALLALELAIVLLHHAAAFRAGDRDGRIDDVRDLARLDRADDLAYELGNLLHELVAAELALLDQLELVLPFAGQLRRCQLDDVQHVQREQQ